MFKVIKKFLSCSPIESAKTWIIKHKYFSSFVFIPWLLIAFYFTAVVSEQYESTTGIVIRENRNQPAYITNSARDKTRAGLSQDESAYLLQTYIQSRDMRNYLDKILMLKQHFQSSHIDIISRLYSFDDDIEYLKYYQNKIAVTYDPMSTMLTISVNTFDPAYSKKVIETILEKSKTFINKVSHNDLIVVTEPNLPSQYSSPRKTYDLITLLIGLMILYTIGKLIVIIIQEHKD